MIKLRVSSGYARVSKRRPCRICGKPDWCSYTRDEEISICMRVREGAYRVNRQGGAIHLHEPGGWSAMVTRVQKAEFPPTPLASIQVRDFVYHELIRLSPAMRFRKTLIEGRKGLVERGFDTRHFCNYGALPPLRRERDQLAAQLLDLVRKHFSGVDSLLGVPGFWEDGGCPRLWLRDDCRWPRLLIPCLAGSEMIQALQTRSVGVGFRRARYCWLSSKDFPGGAGSGNPLHFTFDEAATSPGTAIVIVEGPLKADALVALRPGIHAIAIAGVAASHEALVKAVKGRPVILAFDQDCRHNEAVRLQLRSLIAARFSSENTLTTTRVAVWPDRVKGIDDAALALLPIHSISVDEWVKQLNRIFPPASQSLPA